MNFLDMLDPQKRKALELLQMQQMQQMGVPAMLQQMPQGMGALQNMPMPMQQGQAGYGVIAPQTNTAMNQAAAGGAQSFGQTAMAALPGLLTLAGGAGGQQEVPPPPPPPPPGRPVGTSKEGIPTIGNAFSTVKRRRKVRGLLGDE